MKPDKTDDIIAAQLKAWGTATLNRFAYAPADRSTHLLRQAMDVAPGTTERAARQLVGRDGYERRRLMAAGAGVERMRVVPIWAVDPIPCSNDAGRPHDNPPVAVDMGIPDNLLWLERAIGQLARVNHLRALCVREEYCGTGSQRIKAARVAERYGGEFTLRQYRYELEKARVWLSGYLQVGNVARYRA